MTLKIPEGMRQAALAANIDGTDTSERILRGVELALQWQAANPPVPTGKQLDDLRDAVDQQIENGPGRKTASGSIVYDGTEIVCVEWIRRMYAAPESEVLEEIKDLLAGSEYTPMTGVVNLNPEWDKRIIEAFRRGQKSKIHTP